MLKCGVAQTDITPNLGSDIPGQVHNRISTGIEDPLYAKAIVLDDGIKKIASVVLDAIIIDKNAVKTIREKAAKKCSLDKKAIMVSAIHTHTGPPVGNLYKSKIDNEYMEFLTTRAADCIILALNNMKTAKVGASVGYEDTIAFNRRYKMKDGTYATNPPVKSPDLDMPLGPIDPQVTVVRIDDEKDRPIAILSNYACHLDVVGGTKYSADYPGEIARTISKVLGDDVVSIFYTGTCGNINHINFTERKGKPSGKGKKYSNYMGRVLGYEILKTYEKIQTSSDKTVNFKSSDIRLETRKPDKDQVKKALKAIKENPDDFKNKELIKAYEQNEEFLDAQLQVMSIGDVAISALPGEIFVEFGLNIKQNSPFKYNIVAELSNGSAGYIPVREAFGQGGYEPQLTSYTKADPESGYIICEKILSLLGSL